jgi:hypothetical protein
MNKNNLQFRQGDVFIEKIEALPSGLKKHKKDNGRIILAYGEVTGHAHAIVDDVTASFIDSDGNLYLESKEDILVKHEEHAEIKLPAGVYRITHQREYSPEEIRNVLD